MEHKIVGSTMPVLEIQLAQGDAIVAESGQLSWISSTIEMKTAASGGGHGLLGALGRAASGGTLFLTEYTAHGGPGIVAFAARVPGHIVAQQVGRGQELMVHRHGYLASEPGVSASIAFQKSLGGGIFGGEGFILQKLAGQGTAWVELSGEVVTYDLGPGETLRVHPGHVGMFQESVSFDIVTIKGIRNRLFGGDGMFLVQLKGPGRVWLQSMPLPTLAHALEPYLPQPNRS